MDLFAGIGGFTLGVQQAGYDVVIAADNDETAVATYNENFDHDCVQCNLAVTSPEDFAEMYDIRPEDIDLVVGGPPCQGFSTANLGKSPDDPRNNLVFVFANYVAYFRPDCFVMENVTGIEPVDDGETIERLYDDFEAAGYAVEHTTLNAADYGVPQKRRRVFFVGVHESVDGEPQFPEPTHAPPSEIHTTSSDGQVVADD
jgi:DNA (cytosine-5)-methyltransferase 1